MVIARHLAKGGVDLTELRVPVTEVARCAGHGVAVLPKIYAYCIDGPADAANKRITDALGVQDTGPESDSGDEGMTTASRNLKCQVRGKKAARWSA